MAQAVSSFGARGGGVSADRHRDLRCKAAAVCVEMLESDQGDVRRAAAKALGGVGPEALLQLAPRLARHLGDSSVEVRDSLAALLWRIGPAGVSELERVARQGRPCARNTALRVFEAHGAAGVSLFASLLEDADLSVRLTAANALAQLGDDRGLRVLVAALHDERSRYLRHTGASALARLGSDGAAEIRRALGSSSALVRTAAAEASAARLVGSRASGD